MYSECSLTPRGNVLTKNESILFVRRRIDVFPYFSRRLRLMYRLCRLHRFCLIRRKRLLKHPPDCIKHSKSTILRLVRLSRKWMNVSRRIIVSLSGCSSVAIRSIFDNVWSVEPCSLRANGVAVQSSPVVVYTAAERPAA